MRQVGKRQVRHSDFSEEYLGKPITISLADGKTLSGVLLESRRYWVKVKTNDRVVYINKSFMMSVVPNAQ
ncbi:MAG: hypothetical protein RXQ94_08630 [Caldivirga sp.]